MENWWDHYTVGPEDYVGLKAIMGDSGDNIKGVEGIGPKRATELLTKYGTVFDILDSIPVPGKQKFIQKLNESKDLIQLNLQLVDILSYCEDAIGIGNIEEMGPNRKALRKEPGGDLVAQKNPARGQPEDPPLFHCQPFGHTSGEA